MTDTLNAGGNRPKVGMLVRPAFVKYFIDAPNILNDSHEINTNVDKDTLTQHTYTTVITKSQTADTFEVSIDFDNGTASTTYSVIDSALYTAETLYPIIDSVSANTKGGIRLHSFISTYTQIPEPTTISLFFGLSALVLIALRRYRAQASGL